MKKLIYILPVIIAAIFSASSCNGTDEWDTYEQWRKENEKWVSQQGSLIAPDGKAYYERVNAEWNRGAYVLMHFFNDRNATAGNLSPMWTSTVQVKYKGRLYNDVAFDSSYTAVDSLFTCAPGDVIAGWGLALQNMHVGDSARVIIPWQLAYGSTSTGTIPAYSALQFDIKLVNISGYEIKPQ